MILAVDKEEKDRRRRSGQSTEAGDKRRAIRKRPTPEVGSALRSVYQKTIDEDIPPEMLDLLGKLG
ncbi:NepR family anti-sigma factor [Sphingosinicella rhizophila]|uniref:NepR family anti-sigma factor n=1 Tax=Sphingosinicella rhizophila TaxID=3050082 RepID=A0ABU3Q3T3_9SPHN|nr:NepR family anti-sigma factor [Sphingosinicella sp. GR2756]MDT9598064.1 NepR family anti-sigma factor [Sphingosinicella sp. GR2756]